MTVNEQVAFSWDDEDIEVEERPEFELLPPGDYSFTVANFERGWYEGGDKIIACDFANVMLYIVTPKGSTVTVFEKFFLVSSQAWRIKDFFMSVGLITAEQKPDMKKWDLIAGLSGRAKLGQRRYDGNSYNAIKKFYPKDSAAADPTAPPAGSAFSWET
jgi:hypothetical protein